MLAFQAGVQRLCDGLTRREALRVGGLSALGLSLPRLLAAREAGPKSRARSCIILWMTGGPPQHETWDPKPEQPPEIRGPFGTIPTAIPGVRVGELMPRTAAWLDRLCVIRSMVTNNPGHVGGSYEMMTGAEHPGGKGNEAVVASRSDFPTLAAVVKRFHPPRPGVPPSVVYPQAIFNVPFYPGQDAGFMGSGWDPWRLECNPAAANFKVPELTLLAEVSPSRLGQRLGLLDQVSREFDRVASSSSSRRFGQRTDEAVGLLTGRGVRTAFDLEQEPAAVRDAYGRHVFGQGCLLARRLVEAGVALVQLNWHREQDDPQPMWDAHHNLPTNLRDKLMPPMDQGYTTLLEDLHQRGLLAETLVVWMGEMGRTPKLESVPLYPDPGRNHWGDVFSIALAGAGVKPGLIYGASDPIGGYVKDKPVRPWDVTATIYHALGIPPETEIRDQLDRPLAVSRGRVMHEWFS